jgi:hypothetical protein
MDKGRANLEVRSYEKDALRLFTDGLNAAFQAGCDYVSGLNEEELVKQFRDAIKVRFAGKE